MITMDNWPDNWSEIPAGTEVSEEVYNEMMNALPPISIRGGHGFHCGFQMGEPFDHREDASGRFRARHLTFVKAFGTEKCYYAGLNFGGECKPF